ncbi:putative PLP-dependent aminotransferase [Leptospira kirschneri]|uniref:putative PLP-dependent aminotransferase n=1 Tax=Leptospira kirschneri TaxID=29507 RepID=UPI003561D4C7
MKNRSFFLWPDYNPIQSLSRIIYSKKISSIEDTLETLFPSGYPVLCSSGRAAIGLALEFLDLKRNDFLGVFPFASHCVLDAVSRYTTPLTGRSSKNTKNRIVYHQWGYVQEYNLPPNTIEDCVDTLCIPGAKLFPAGGMFEIWSLPKILGTSSGGVLWCREEKVASQIKAIRDGRKYSGAIQWYLKLFSYKFPSLLSYWTGVEASNGKLSFLQTGEIHNSLNNWQKFIDDKLKKFKLTKSLTPNWLHVAENRLPSVIPIEISFDQEKLKEWGITTGFRNFVRNVKEQKFVKVFPLPIHIDVPYNLLKKIVDDLTLMKEK